MTDIGADIRRATDRIAKRGAPVTLRRVTLSDGPAPLVNPPVMAGLVVDGAVLQGATAISLRATRARGRLIVGDRIVLAGMVPGQYLQVTAETAARSSGTPGFSSVPVTAAPAPYADGTVAAMAYAAETKTFAVIGGYPMRLIDGDRIRATDLQVTLGAAGIAAPTTGDVLRFNTFDHAIVSITPAMKRGVPVMWVLQARAQ